MIISDQHRFGFVHIPKSAGTTVRFALMDLDQRKERYFGKARAEHPDLGLLDYHHLPLSLVKELYPDDFALIKEYRTFALIRDPRARFASSLHEYLRWNTQDRLSELTPDARKAIVHRVIKDLDMWSDDTPIIDPALIHFSRQSDYIDCSGERVVSDIYPTEQLTEMLRALSAITGEEITHASKNQRFTYKSGALRSASELAQRTIRRVLPEDLTSPLFTKVREAMMAGGLVELERGRDFSELFDDDVDGFVERFYRRDYALRREIMQPPAKRA